MLRDKGSFPLPVERQAAGAGMLGVAFGVDVHGLTAGTDAGVDPGEGTGAGGLPKGLFLAVCRLRSGGNGAPVARVFEAGFEGFVRAVLAGEGWQRIRAFPLKTPQQVKVLALL